MATRNERARVWVSWLPKLLVGTFSCEWSVWFQSHYSYYKKVPSTTDFSAWNVQHTELLNTIQSEYQQRFKTVTREEQNRFEYIGKTGAKLSGKPDLIGVSDTEFVICDAKTGQQKDEHRIQVLLYLWAFPLCFPDLCDGLELSGELIYADGQRIKVTLDEFNGEFKGQFYSMMKTITTFESSPRKTPSEWDCNNCPITQGDCEHRIVARKSQQKELGDF